MNAGRPRQAGSLGGGWLTPALPCTRPQVSGIRFSFDGSLPPGQRVVPGSVSVGGADLQPDALYSLATKAYLAEGRDGEEGAVALRGSCSLLLCFW